MGRLSLPPMWPGRLISQYRRWRLNFHHLLMAGQINTNFASAEAPDDFTVIFKSKDGKSNPRMHRWFCSAFDTGLSIMPKHIFEKLDPATIDQASLRREHQIHGSGDWSFHPRLLDPREEDL